MLDVRRLRVLVEVARHGSFSAAAEQLGYTQPAISRQVAVLEAEVGATLVERRPEGARLTDAGRLLVDHAETIIARLDDAEAELKALLGMEAGRLRMSTLTSAAATLVPPAIGEFRKRAPNVDLSVAMVDPGGVLPLLRSGEIDLALVNDSSLLEHPDVEGTVLFEEPMLAALPADHPLARRRRITLEQLADERWMLGTTGSCPDAGRFIRTCHARGFEPKVAFHHDDYSAILGFVAAGVGVAVVPDMVAREVPRGVSIKSLGADAPRRPIAVAMPSGYRPAPVREMLDVLEQVAQRWVAQAPPELVAA